MRATGFVFRVVRSAALLAVGSCATGSDFCDTCNRVCTDEYPTRYAPIDPPPTNARQIFDRENLCFVNDSECTENVTMAFECVRSYAPEEPFPAQATCGRSGYESVVLSPNADRFQRAFRFGYVDGKLSEIVLDGCYRADAAQPCSAWTERYEYHEGSKALARAVQSSTTAVGCANRWPSDWRWDDRGRAQLWNKYDGCEGSLLWHEEFVWSDDDRLLQVWIDSDGDGANDAVHYFLHDENGEATHVQWRDPDGTERSPILPMGNCCNPDSCRGAPNSIALGPDDG